MTDSPTILDKLASALGRKNQIPNQELAQNLADSCDMGALKCWVENTMTRLAK